MSKPIVLENFDAPAPPPVPRTVAPTVNLESATAEAYERGYKAGWDDCLDGTRREQIHISETFGRRLSEVQISVDDVRNSVIEALRPLFSDIFQKLLPSVAQTGFRDELVAQVLSLSQTRADMPLEIRVSPEDLDAMTALLNGLQTGPQLTVIADPALGLTQARLRLGDATRQIDMMHIVDGVETAFEALAVPQQERAHG